MKIVLAICTCGRPQRLRRLLQSLSDLEFDGDLAVVVIENHAGLEGQRVCLESGAACRWPVRCVFEPQPGISFARNRAVDEALAQGADAIAMLDDDEWPEPRWLAELVRVQRETGAAVVGGPVIPRFDDARIGWERYARYYGLDQKLPDAAPCTLYGAGNVLVLRACFTDLVPEPFDPAFALSGGEDLAFFARLAQRGFTMRWAARAVAYEWIPRQRMTMEWLVQRQLRRGCLNVAVPQRLEPGMVQGGLRWAKTAARSAHAAVLRAASLVDGRLRDKAAFASAYALGRWQGHAGRLVDDYRAVPPPVDRPRSAEAGVR